MMEINFYLFFFYIFIHFMNYDAGMRWEKVQKLVNLFKKFPIFYYRIYRWGFGAVNCCFVSYLSVLITAVSAL